MLADVVLSRTYAWQFVEKATARLLVLEPLATLFLTNRQERPRSSSCERCRDVGAELIFDLPSPNAVCRARYQPVPGLDVF